MKREIKLGTKYSLDLGSLAPVDVVPIGFTEKGVVCQYENSYPGRVEELGYELFKINGFNINELNKEMKEQEIEITTGRKLLTNNNFGGCSIFECTIIEITPSNNLKIHYLDDTVKWFTKEVFLREYTIVENLDTQVLLGH